MISARPHRRFAEQRPAGRRRAGFTLVEILLVLVVLATIAALISPVALRIFGDYALKQSAEAVRSDLTRARLNAVQEGVVYEFRAESGGDRWVVVPAEREAGSADPDAVTDWVPVSAGTLSEGVTFPSDGALSLTTGRPTADYFLGLPDASQLAQLQWAPPIRFQPDGTAAEAFVTISDERGGVRVAVRSLTGTASIEPVPVPTLGGPTLGTPNAGSMSR
ncbi:prepilin-type N-terminal cleavage/methylation domain-containing protein [Alienimonas chondri]|uniref:Type II secretion system protein H n=1 Tax=Alienimonas chondri TaxID=2681879 RepID=A0ABX1VEK6_9PLAN|nr:prepilin-type N-terminal cleavage/methylation domain-containing protein [Alienimonas chondri]NNJ25718.1 hypothetical protein [Alienimonas chondri]